MQLDLGCEAGLVLGLLLLGPAAELHRRLPGGEGVLHLDGIEDAHGEAVLVAEEEADDGSSGGQGRAAGDYPRLVVRDGDEGEGMALDGLLLLGDGGGDAGIDVHVIGHGQYF